MQQENRFNEIQRLQEMVKANMANVKHKIIVLSGKGGVGKSTVATNIACGLAQLGKKVGIIDTDIHGPSLAKMLGIEGQFMQPGDGEHSMKAVEAKGIKIATMASLLPDADAPVIWRGPLKISAIKQFIGDVVWGPLDYLVIDSPPGTGDEPLTVAQLIPEADGAIIVTTPQDVALIDSRKTVNFARAMKLNVLGIIENMSGFSCPHCHQPIDLFKVGGGQQTAINMGVPFLGAIPIDRDAVDASDDGTPLVLEYPDSHAGKAFKEIIDRLVETIEQVHG
ncbi:Mrp/NBP35 family ATP-binding protein [candidate division KSB1 bacterium]|nr:Mrp/NBP35 family ATP-binding protein [candidate division KSB1 bacterium]